MVSKINFFLILVGKDYHQEAAVYRSSESHGGEDVSVYASGPMSHLFTTTIEQSFIMHAMAYSACNKINYFFN
jgi:alkaline phosphatase